MEKFLVTQPLNPSSKTPPSSPQKTSLKRIPEGTILATIPLEAAKAFPTYLFKTKEEIRYAYADSTKGERIELQIKYTPTGPKKDPHPQIIFYVWGDYHVEPHLDYGGKSDPFKWATWFECHLDPKFLTQFISAYFKLQELQAK